MIFDQNGQIPIKRNRSYGAKEFAQFRTKRAVFSPETLLWDRLLMPISGKQVVKILQKNGFQISRQRGSHTVLHKITPKGKRVGVVPNHKEVQKGTLKSIAKMTGLDREELGLL